MTFPIEPVMMYPLLPGMRVASIKRTSPPAGSGNFVATPELMRRESSSSGLKITPKFPPYFH
jgi:hypothetical protein